MTLPSEELKTLDVTTREFLRDLATGPRSPTKALRARARACLHHYPLSCNLVRLYAPRIRKSEPWRDKA